MKIVKVVLLFACLILGCGSQLFAQQLGQWMPRPMGPNANAISDPEDNYANLNVSTDAALASSSSAAEGSGSGSGAGNGQGLPTMSTANDDQWHLSVSPYLWFPGIHGTVGAAGHDAGFKVSPGTLISKLRIGFMGSGEARRNRLLTTLDFFYVRLGDDKAIPFPPIEGVTYANFTVNVVILTPKVGFRVINQDKIKADVLAGFRYWYAGESVSFNPSMGNNFSRSQNFVDPLVGGKIIADLSPKVGLTIGGDVGGWGHSSQLEYQAFGALGYKLKDNLTLQAGYRYLNLDYARVSGEVNPFINLTMSGVFVGATLNLK